MYSETPHSDIGETRLHQCQHVVAEVVQYIKMTKELDSSKMTNKKEILPQCRDQLETEINAIGQNAITEKTKTVREREPSSLPLYKLYTLFRLHTGEKRSTQQSQLLRPQTGGRRVRGGWLETNTRSRGKLRTRNNNCGTTPSIKILIRYREIDG